MRFCAPAFRLVRLRGLSDRLAVFERVSRTHFLALVHTRQASPPSRVGCIAVPVHVDVDSLRAERMPPAPGGGTVDRARLRVSFAFNARARVRVQLLWGLRPSFVALDGLRGVAGAAEAPSLSHARDRTPLIAGMVSPAKAVEAELPRELEALAVHASEPRSFGPGLARSYVDADSDALALPAPFELTWHAGDRFPLAILLSPERDDGARPARSAVEEISSQLILVSFDVHSSDGVEPKYAPHIVQQLNLTSSAAYLAQEIYGMDEEAGAECVICLTNIKDTTLLPCRHLCVCSECLKHIDKCPVCRAPFETYMVFDTEGISAV